MAYGMVGEPMVCGKSSLACGIHCCPNFFIISLPNQHLYIVKNVYIYTYVTVWRLYINYHTK